MTYVEDSVTVDSSIRSQVFSDTYVDREIPLQSVGASGRSRQLLGDISHDSPWLIFSDCHLDSPVSLLVPNELTSH